MGKCQWYVLKAQVAEYSIIAWTYLKIMCKNTYTDTYTPIYISIADVCKPTHRTAYCDYIWGKGLKTKRVRNHFPFYSIYISYCCCLVTKLCLILCDPMDQAVPSMEFSRQEYWSGLPCPPPGDLPDPGIEPVFPALAGRFFTTDSPGKHIHLHFFLTFDFGKISVLHYIAKITQRITL